MGFEEKKSDKSSNAMTLYNLGLDRSKNGDHAGAAYAFKQAITIDPQSINAWINLGNELNELGNHFDAIEAYEHALTINPEYVLPWCKLGMTRQALGDHMGAVKAFKKAIDLDTVLAENVNPTIQNDLRKTREKVNHCTSEILSYRDVAFAIERICNSHLQVMEDWFDQGYFFEVNPPRIEGCRRAYVFPLAAQFNSVIHFPGPVALRLFDDEWFCYLVSNGKTYVAIFRKNILITQANLQILLNLKTDLETLTAKFLALEQMLRGDLNETVKMGKVDLHTLDKQLAEFIDMFCVFQKKIPQMTGLWIPQFTHELLWHHFRESSLLEQAIKRSNLGDKIIGPFLDWSIFATLQGPPDFFINMMSVDKKGKLEMWQQTGKPKHPQWVRQQDAYPHENALRYYLQRLESNPKEPDTWGNLAHAQLALGKIDDARESLKHGLKIDPSKEKLILSFIDIAKQSNQYGDLLGLLESAITKNPHYWKFPALLSLIYFQLLHNEDKAFAICTQCIGLQDFETHREEFLKLCKEWRVFPLIIHLYKHYVVKNPTEPTWWHSLGWWYAKIGNQEEKTNAYLEAIKLNRAIVDKQPDNSSAWFELSKLYRNLGRLSESLDALNHSLKIKNRDENCNFLFLIEQFMVANFSQDVEAWKRLAKGFTIAEHLVEVNNRQNAHFQIFSPFYFALRAIQMCLLLQPNDLEIKEWFRQIHAARQFMNQVIQLQNQFNEDQIVDFAEIEKQFHISIDDQKKLITTVEEVGHSEGIYIDNGTKFRLHYTGSNFSGKLERHLRENYKIPFIQE